MWAAELENSSLCSKKNGVKTIFGIDGPWTSKEKLCIPKNCFQHANLEHPLHIPKKFDLALSIEVAEHLSKNAAETFVTSLTDLAPIILFSAAIPYQGGLDHINLQWPDYWAKLFSKKGYVPIDCVRRKIWSNENVVACHAQNILLFAKKEVIEANSILKKEFEQTEPSALSIVHPKHYLPKARRVDSLSKLVPKPLRLVLLKCMDLFNRRNSD